MISTVFFDSSGTLVSGDLDVPACRESVARYLRSRGFRVSTERYAMACEAGLHELRIRRKVGREITYEDFMRTILRDLGISDKAPIKEIEQIEFDHYHWIPVPHVRKVLSELSNSYRLAIISNGMADSAIHILKERKLLSLFETVVLSRDVGYRKPHPAIFNHALRELGVSAGESVFVGDNATADVLGARNVGMNAILISRGKEVPPEGFIDDPFLYLATDITEVPHAIRQLDSLESKDMTYHPPNGIRMVTPGPRKGS